MAETDRIRQSNVRGITASHENLLESLGYSADHAELLCEVLHDLAYDSPEIKAKVLKTFALIAGVVRKPRTKKA